MWRKKTPKVIRFCLLFGCDGWIMWCRDWLLRTDFPAEGFKPNIGTLESPCGPQSRVIHFPLCSTTQTRVLSNSYSLSVLMCEMLSVNEEDPLLNGEKHGRREGGAEGRQETERHRIWGQLNSFPRMEFCWCLEGGETEALWLWNCCLSWFRITLCGHMTVIVCGSPSTSASMLFWPCFLRLVLKWLILLQVRSVSSTVTRRREHRVLVMVVVMVVCYLICWLPYGVTALLATFGPPNLLTPEATIAPSLLAKFSTVINPVIYIFMNKQVRWVSVCYIFITYLFCLCSNHPICGCSFNFTSLNSLRKLIILN